MKIYFKILITVFLILIISVFFLLLLIEITRFSGLKTLFASKAILSSEIEEKAAALSFTEKYLQPKIWL